MSVENGSATREPLRKAMWCLFFYNAAGGSEVVMHCYLLKNENSHL